MTEEQTDKPREYLIGLGLGTLVAAAAWFLYQTKKGQTLRSWWEKYFKELKSEWDKLQLPAPPAAKPPRRLRRLKPPKKLFLKSGKPLIK